MTFYSQSRHATAALYFEIMYFVLKKPITPSQRHLIRTSRKHLKEKPLLKNKLFGFLNKAGRSSNTGKITVRHKGGGHKKKYRKIDFYRTLESEGIVCSIEYDPNRSARIASIYNATLNFFFYIIAPLELNVGDIVKSGKDIKPKTGYSLPLLQIPEGAYLHNISIKKNQISTISRAAGTFSTLLEKAKNITRIKLSSGEIKNISSNCFASIGIVSNAETYLAQLGKAGHSRWLNKRPSVRGVAMNPIDHPNGGGEGKKSGKGKTPWGKN